ncbi:SRPBCC family protein [Actinomycetospora endophytica]|nr:SRPBCC family protein [Actinomycetospora endophytica]
MTETEQQDRAATNGHAPDAGSDGIETPSLPTDRLKQAAQLLLKALSDKAVGAAVNQVEGLTGKLSDVAESGGVGLTSAFGGGDDEGGGGGGIGGALKAGASAVKDKVTGALGMGGGDDDEDPDGSGGGGGGGSGSGRGKFKFMNIFEAQDVGVPIRVAYDQWTQFADFPSFMKKLESVNQEADEKSTWTAKVFWSRRSWTTTIREQVPDSHIIWVSSGAKGRADGIVSFHELAPNMTRIILILEYYPQGFMEKTGNIWRAVGRRARLEFKHFCRHVMMDTLINREELEGWRGEIRDSEVVKTHEEAMEEEQAAAEASEDDEFDDEDIDDEFSDDEGAPADDDEFVAEDVEPEDDLEDDDIEDRDDDAEFEDAEDAEFDDEDLDDGFDDEDDDLPQDEDEGDDPDEPERPRRRRQRTPA